MAKIQNQISNLTGGEISPRLDGRPDVAKQRNGLRLCENMQVVVHGGARKRSGTRYVGELKSTDDVVFQRFQYSTEQAYMLVFGPNYIWILKDRGILTDTALTITAISKANPGVVTYTGTDPSNGDRVIIAGVTGMTEVNNRQFVVANVDTGANTFELSGVDTSSYTTYSANGSAAPIIEVTTTYAETELQELRFAQYNDVLYITHENHPLRKLTRNSETSWTLSAVSITTGPFRTINGDDTHRMTVSSFSGSATAYGTQEVGRTFTLTSSTAFFDADMVGALFRLNEDGGGTGIAGPRLGDNSLNLSDGDVYTNDSKVYGASDLSTAAIAWNAFNRVPNHDRGSVVVHGSTGAGDYYFTANFLHPTYCIVQITAYSSSTSVTAQIVRYQMPKSIIDSGTVFWEEGAWSAYRGYPRSCAFFEQRLFLGGSTADPAVLWSSKSGAFEDFSDGSDDDDALVYRSAAGSADVIRWLSGGKVLVVGTSAGEFAVAASNQNEALTPSNVKMLLQSSYGTSDAPPVRFNDVVLYPQRNGEPANAARKIREFAYEFTSDKFNSVDLTIFAEHITGSGVTRLEYSMSPDPMIWAVRSDGEIACCTYERLQEVVAWQRYVLAGSGAAQTIGACAGASGEDVYVVVERTISGATVRYIEVFEPPFEPAIDSKADAFMVDCGLTYSGSSTSTVTGLWHLRGEDVSILNNGNVESATVSSTGTVALDVASTKAQIGYAIAARLVSQDLDGGAQAGASQSRTKRVSQVYARVYGSLLGKVGKYGGTLEDMLYRDVDDVMGSTPDLYSGLIETDVEIGYDREAIVEFQHNDPLPFFITAFVAEQSTVG